MGICVPLTGAIEGLDIGEHGNQAYPEFVSHRASYVRIVADIDSVSTGTNNKPTIKAKDGGMAS